MGTYIVGAIVLGMTLLALRSTIQSRKKGSCAGCTGCAAAQQPGAQSIQPADTHVCCQNKQHTS
jgi:hypothetical protein